MASVLCLGTLVFLFQLRSYLPSCFSTFPCLFHLHFSCSSCSLPRPPALLNEVSPFQPDLFPCLTRQPLQQGWGHHPACGADIGGDPGAPEGRCSPSGPTMGFQEFYEVLEIISIQFGGMYHFTLSLEQTPLCLSESHGISRPGKGNIS